MLATLALKQDGLAKVRKLAKINTDADLAHRIGIDPGNLSRVLAGKAAPGPKFIAGLMDAFGTEWFTDLFEVVPGDEDTAA
jgi:transcriptional regulator with XRE-family HTH domain